MPSATATRQTNTLQEIGTCEFIDCDCRSVFRVLLFVGLRFVEIRKTHSCRSCRKRVRHHAQLTGQHLLEEQTSCQ
jgi:hypothetical protein